MDWKKAKAKHLRLGAKGERISVRLIKEFGLTVLGTNYQIRGGEIDIIALDGDTICFIEVKTRQVSSNSFLERPADAVGFHKKKRLRRAAKEYLYQRGFPKLVHRFDVIEVLFDGIFLKSINWIPEFFKMELDYQDGFDFE